MLFNYWEWGREPGAQLPLRSVTHTEWGECGAGFTDSHLFVKHEYTTSKLYIAGRSLKVGLSPPLD